MLDDRQRLGRVAVYMTESFRLLGDMDQAVASGQWALALATTCEDIGLQVMARFFVGSLSYTLGSYRRAIDLLGGNVASLQGERMHKRFGMTGLPAVLSRVYLSWALAELERSPRVSPRDKKVSGLLRRLPTPSV